MQCPNPRHRPQLSFRTSSNNTTAACPANITLETPHDPEVGKFFFYKIFKHYYFPHHLDKVVNTSTQSWSRLIRASFADS